jgi:uncharacterized protein YsxB (DUF464 family)
MIKSVVEKSKQGYKRVTINDHAFNQNLVCAAVSTAVTMTVNAFEKLDVHESVRFELKRGDFELVVIHHSKLGNLLIENLIFILSELQRDYPEQITLSAKYNAMEE